MEINSSVSNAISNSYIFSANLYLDTNREMRDLYYEEHHDTAIMFASILTNDLQDLFDEKNFLWLMNEYIIAFDTVRYYIHKKHSK